MWRSLLCFGAAHHEERRRECSKQASAVADNDARAASFVVVECAIVYHKAPCSVTFAYIYILCAESWEYCLTCFYVVESGPSVDIGNGYD